MSQGKIRIIAGQLGGRYLPRVPMEGVRPSTSFVRERVFAWLGPSIAGKKVVDFFCGTGAMSFEAVSRGAHSCVCLDHASSVVDYVLQVARMFQVENKVLVKRWRYPEPLSSIDDRLKADILIWDPPYGAVLPEQALSWILSQELLCPGAVLYLEDQRGTIWPEVAGLVLWRKGQSGGSAYALYRLEGV